METFANNLKRLREERGLSQAEVAKALGVSLNAYRRREKGFLHRGLNFLVSVADFYDVSTDSLIGRKN